MKAWHFLGTDQRLRYGDNRQVELGQTYTVPQDRPLELCKYGLHASKRILDALPYAPGPIVCRVELVGQRIDSYDKSVAYTRRVGWMLDITDVLWQFARMCALDVIHLWDAPDVVVRYLKTGDETLRYAAWYAANIAWYAALYATRHAAEYAAKYAANIAWYAARDAAQYAANAAEYEANAAEYEARGAVRYIQNRRLTAMVMAARRSNDDKRI